MWLRFYLTYLIKKKTFIHSCIYLAAPGLVVAFGTVHPTPLWHAGSIFSCSTGTLSCSMRDLIPCPGIQSGPLHWEHGVLATGLAWRSLF